VGVTWWGEAPERPKPVRKGLQRSSSMERARPLRLPSRSQRVEFLEEVLNWRDGIVGEWAI